MRPQIIESIQISEIVKTTETYILARISGTGKLVYLPRSCTQFFPGMAVVPGWLARRLGATPDPTPTVTRQKVAPSTR